MDVRHSEYKSLTPFLKASAKEGLIKVKETKGEVVVTCGYCFDNARVCSHSDPYAGVNQSHSSIDEHPDHLTVKDVEEKKERNEERERREEQKAKEKERELRITLLWKPHMANVALFRAAGRE